MNIYGSRQNIISTQHTTGSTVHRIKRNYQVAITLDHQKCPQNPMANILICRCHTPVRARAGTFFLRSTSGLGPQQNVRTWLQTKIELWTRSSQNAGHLISCLFGLNCKNVLVDFDLQFQNVTSKVFTCRQLSPASNHCAWPPLQSYVFFLELRHGSLVRLLSGAR